MKKSVFCLPFKWVSVILLQLCVTLSLWSCSMLGNPADTGKGYLRIAFADGQECLTRAGLQIPDTCDFILTVKDAKGKTVYEGSYGAFPESLSLDAGSYTVNVISEKFVKPAFSSPQFGDDQCVVIPSGGSADVKLVCTQLNSGIRLKIDEDFLSAYPDGVLLLKGAAGRLVYGYSEKRIAYFSPGDISLVLNEGSSDKVLMTRNLEPREILELKVVISSGNASGQRPSCDAARISISVDTTRNWTSEVYTIGGDNDKGSGTYDALTVADALNSVGEEDVWVCGYIVGGDLSSSSASFDPPFESRTNLLLAPKSTTGTRNSCLSVQLASGEIRDELNLVDNPSMLGRKICLKGDIVEAYYGLTGIKNITDYELF